jgi:hypothetical protein
MIWQRSATRVGDGGRSAASANAGRSAAGDGDVHGGEWRTGDLRERDVEETGGSTAGDREAVLLANQELNLPIDIEGRGIGGQHDRINGSGAGGPTRDAVPRDTGEERGRGRTGRSAGNAADDRVPDGNGGRVEPLIDTMDQERRVGDRDREQDVDDGLPSPRANSGGRLGELRAGWRTGESDAADTRGVGKARHVDSGAGSQRVRQKIAEDKIALGDCAIRGNQDVEGGCVDGLADRRSEQEQRDHESAHLRLQHRLTPFLCFSRTEL